MTAQLKQLDYLLGENKRLKSELEALQKSSEEDGAALERKRAYEEASARCSEERRKKAEADTRKVRGNSHAVCAAPVEALGHCAASMLPMCCSLEPRRKYCCSWST